MITELKCSSEVPPSSVLFAQTMLRLLPLPLPILIRLSSLNHSVLPSAYKPFNMKLPLENMGKIFPEG